MSSAVNVFVHAIHKHSQKVPRVRSGIFLVCLDQFPLFNNHSVALVLLYNMRLEQSLSIEQFQSYVLLNLAQKFHFNA